MTDGGANVDVEKILNDFEVDNDEFAMEDYVAFSSGRSAKAPDASALSPLQKAEAREQRLIAVRHRELTSPLQVKRRLRSSAVALRTHSRRHGAGTGAGAAGAGGSGGGGGNQFGSGVGVVRVEAMETISRQLQKNAQFQQHGPGLPTAVSVHSKFIAVGTSRSLVLVFDHFQEVRQVLGNTAEAKDDGPVTAIDVSRGSDYLVCGYCSGRIVLWDIMKGQSLKAISDAHAAPIASLRFWQDRKPCVVSVDTKGLVNKVGAAHAFPNTH
jgi:hypothetical protein